METVRTAYLPSVLNGFIHGSDLSEVTVKVNCIYLTVLMAVPVSGVFKACRLSNSAVAAV